LSAINDISRLRQSSMAHASCGDDLSLSFGRPCKICNWRKISPLRVKSSAIPARPSLVSGVFLDFNGAQP